MITHQSIMPFLAGSPKTVFHPPVTATNSGKNEWALVAVLANCSHHTWGMPRKLDRGEAQVLAGSAHTVPEQTRRNLGQEEQITQERSSLETPWVLAARGVSRLKL